MAIELDYDYYTRMAQHELDLASSATDKTIKALHLNMAAEYATMGERSINSEDIILEKAKR